MRGVCSNRVMSGDRRDPDRELSVVEVAKRFGVSRRTVERWLEDGRLVASKRGSRTFIDAAEVLRFLEEHES